MSGKAINLTPASADLLRAAKKYPIMARDFRDKLGRPDKALLQLEHLGYLRYTDWRGTRVYVLTEKGHHWLEHGKAERKPRTVVTATPPQTPQPQEPTRHVPKGLYCGGDLSKPPVRSGAAAAYSLPSRIGGALVYPSR
jgi:hypothetical protein